MNGCDFVLDFPQEAFYFEYKYITVKTANPCVTFILNDAIKISVNQSTLTLEVFAMISARFYKFVLTLLLGHVLVCTGTHLWSDHTVI